MSAIPDSFASTGVFAHRVTSEPPEMFQVIGERGSGTNVVRKLIDKNIASFRTEALGWKHGFPRMLAVPDNLLTIVCIRNAESWALSMHKRPWHADPRSSSRKVGPSARKCSGRTRNTSGSR